MVSGFTAISDTMMVGMLMRETIATSAASGMWMGSGTKQIASPAPNAGVHGATLQRPQARIAEEATEGFEGPVVAQRFAGAA
jgi:hypothetical protein